MKSMAIPESLDDIDPSLCAIFDRRMNSKYVRRKVKQLGYDSFHMAACALLFDGKSLKEATEILDASKNVIMHATRKFRLRWPRYRNGIEASKIPRKTKYIPRHLEETPTGKQRPCAKCGTMFEITAKRRMLCDMCFRSAEIEETTYNSRFI